MLIRFLAFSTVVTCIAATGRAEDWPQFRGPGGTGVVTAKVLPPSRWNATENVGWKVEIPGRGWSCPILAGGVCSC
jgi:hypothetical protein